MNTVLEEQNFTYETPTKFIVDPSTDTYNAPAVRIGTYLLHADYLKALAEKNRTVYVTREILSFMSSGTVIPDRGISMEDNPLLEYIAPHTTGRRISAAQAYEIAVKSLLDAENRRRNEREAEARFWESLDGEE